MYYKEFFKNHQLPLVSDKYIKLESSLTNFFNVETTSVLTKSDKLANCIEGFIIPDSEAPNCPCCASKMYLNKYLETRLRHIPFGQKYCIVKCKKIQYRCPKCNKTHSQDIPFQAPNHLITKELLTYIESLLSKGTYTNKDIAELAGVGQNVVKDIDLESDEDDKEEIEKDK